MAKRNFLGKGWKFPVSVNGAGGIGTSDNERSVEEAIEIILGTAPGERVYRSNFGCAIHDLVFEPNNDETASKAVAAVDQALKRLEPRIDGIEVHAYFDALEDNKLLLDIHYRVVAENNLFNLVYPFYLRREQDL